MTIPELENKIQVLQDSKETVLHQIDMLKDYVSQPQLSVWRRQVRELNIKIKYRQEQLNKLKNGKAF